MDTELSVVEMIRETCFQRAKDFGSGGKHHQPKEWPLTWQEFQDLREEIDRSGPSFLKLKDKRSEIFVTNPTNGDEIRCFLGP